MSSKILIYLFINGFPSALFSIQNNIFFFEQKVFNFLFMYQTLIQTFQNDWVESSTQSSLVIQNSCSTDYAVLYHHPKANNLVSTPASKTPIPPWVDRRRIKPASFSDMTKISDAQKKLIALMIRQISLPSTDPWCLTRLQLVKTEGGGAWNRMKRDWMGSTNICVVRLTNFTTRWITTFLLH